MSHAAVAACTTSALNRSCFPLCGHKVRCHTTEDMSVKSVGSAGSQSQIPRALACRGEIELVGPRVKLPTLLQRKSIDFGSTKPWLRKTAKTGAASVEQQHFSYHARFHVIHYFSFTRSDNSRNSLACLWLAFICNCASCREFSVVRIGTKASSSVATSRA
jgi:hypothetical protein